MDTPETESCGTPVASALQRQCFEETVASGWDPGFLNTLAEEITHLHSELSEAFEAWRLYHDTEIHYGGDGEPEGVPIEFADALIGMLYNAELHGFDLFEALEVKRRYNLGRDYQAEGRQLHSGRRPTDRVADQ